MAYNNAFDYADIKPTGFKEHLLVWLSDLVDTLIIWRYECRSFLRRFRKEKQ